MRIAARYCGPPDSGNGGVTCGLLAEYVDAPVVEVTLRRPPPLDTDLRLDGGALYDEDLLVATAVPAELDVTAPTAVPLQRAIDAASAYEGRSAHPFPTCFVCGIDREPPDALGLRPGPVGGGVLAAVWTPEDAERFLVWAALDCPGGWAAGVGPGRPMVLGRMALEHRAAVTAVGEPHVVLGWRLGGEGRKWFSATALYAPDGQVLAVTRQTWIAIPA